MADILTEEQLEDTRDGLQEWLISLGYIGKQEAVTEDGIPYTTVTVNFTADEVEKAVKEFKDSVMKLQGTNGCYIRVLPSLAFDGGKLYTLRTRVAPKGQEA